jgi:single-stranded-DNA-specific exonuclease
MSLFDRIIAARGLNAKNKAAFLLPDYDKCHDPFLLPDMDKAIERLDKALAAQEKIVIHGDYDIDGLTAATLIKDAFSSFGFKSCDIFIPNRFEEGYGLTVEAIEKFAEEGFGLIVAVDCGTNSVKEISRAKELGVDVIVVDHHEPSVKNTQANALINPKIPGSKYPFKDLAGVGVAFKLVQAMQTRLEDVPPGQEKWLLDLVAVGTVCDVVELVDENRTFVYWGLKVLRKTRRLGLKALMAISAVEPERLNTYSIGFRLGPRMNAAGRLETARHALELLNSQEPEQALRAAEYLEDLNKSRRFEQNKIFKEAVIQAESHGKDPVIVVSATDWNHGIVGIVASKLMEKYKKPSFVLQEMGDEAKGSARSFGDFSAVDAVNNSKNIIAKGGGHKYAAGLTLSTKNIPRLRKQINDYYNSLSLNNQEKLLLPKVDAIAKLDELNEEVVHQISQLEPFGIGNPEPVVKCENLEVVAVRKMGDDGQHLKLDLKDGSGRSMQFLSFNSPKPYYVEYGEKVSVCFRLSVNEWRGSRTVEGQIVHLETIK